MDYRVVFAPEAEEQLAELYRYIAQSATPYTALNHASGSGTINPHFAIHAV